MCLIKKQKIFPSFIELVIIQLEYLCFSLLILFWSPVESLPIFTPFNICKNPRFYRLEYMPIIYLSWYSVCINLSILSDSIKLSCLSISLSVHSVLSVSIYSVTISISVYSVSISLYILYLSFYLSVHSVSICLYTSPLPRIQVSSWSAEQESSSICLPHSLGWGPPGRE